MVSFGWESLFDLGAGLPRRGARHDAGGLPAGVPAGCGQPARRGPRPGGGGAQPRRRAGAHLLCGSPSARPEAPSSAAACWWRWCSSPSTARSRCSATSTFTTEIFTSLQLPTEVPGRLRAVPRAGCHQPARAGRRRVAARQRPGGQVRPAGAARRAAAASWPRRQGRGAGGAPCCSWRRSACRSAPASTGSSGAACRRSPARSACPCSAPPGTPRCYGVFAAAIETLLALPVALLAIRHAGRDAAAPGAQHVPGAGDARRRDRARADLFHRAVRQRLRLPDRAAARALLRDHVLPACAGRGQGRHRACARQPRGGGPVAWPAPTGRVQPGHAAARGAGPDGGVLPGVPGGRDRAHRDPHPAANWRGDAGHPVLAVPDQPLLRVRPRRSRW